MHKDLLFYMFREIYKIIGFSGQLHYVTFTLKCTIATENTSSIPITSGELYCPEPRSSIPITSGKFTVQNLDSVSQLLLVSCFI